MIRWLKRKAYKRRKKSIGNITNEIFWGQIFDFATRDSEWFTSTRLNPGRWALGFPSLYIMFRTLDEIRPRSILEFGLGESTRMTSQYFTRYPGTELTVVEQNAEWKEFFCLNRPYLKESIKIVPVLTSGSKRRRRYEYDGLKSAIEGKKYDFILIDGPTGSHRDSRREILDVVEAGLLADDFAIVFDDTERQGEQDTLKKLYKLLNSKGIPYSVGRYRGQKTAHIICSEKYGFLTSL